MPVGKGRQQAKLLCKRRSISEDKSYRGMEAGKVQEGITGVAGVGLSEKMIFEERPE